MAETVTDPPIADQEELRHVICACARKRFLTQKFVFNWTSPPPAPNSPPQPLTNKVYKIVCPSVDPASRHRESQTA